MLCTQCRKHEATTHIKRIVNGCAQELHLCPACAKDCGLPGAALAFPDFGFQLSDLFSGILGSSMQQLIGAPAGGTRCGFCGSSLHEIVQSGRVGCAQCYETFRDELEPTLRRIHGSLEHSGKSPEDTNPQAHARKLKEQHLTNLRAQIAQAVSEENYEEAARLRDEIRRAEEEGGEGDA